MTHSSLQPGSNTESDEEKESLHLLIILSRAYQAVMNQVNDDIQSYGLNPTEFGVLDFLYHSENPQPLQKIGQKVLISSGNITYVVDKLEKKKMLCRRACDNDRRVIFAELTAEGNQFFESIFTGHKQAIMKATQGLNHNEKLEIIPLLKKLGYAAANKEV
ncbi:MarR family winged helix-turn-helix transcriptional regulator [Paenibacillus nicotianae]|uniref:MarR family winged helix-turn-helix transcriptional regulator n=1 Tax=Paenibacillus nicotianae TaxID=1526551 RepID=A0ABW4UY20_9BACL